MLRIARFFVPNSFGAQNSKRGGDLVVQKSWWACLVFVLGNIVLHLRSLNSPYVFLGNQAGGYVHTHEKIFFSRILGMVDGFMTNLITTAK